MLTIAGYIALIALAVVHVIAPSLRFLDGTPRSVWLSIAGGVSVAYVFVHLLPELAAGQQHVSRAMRSFSGEHRLLGLAFAERHVYLIALSGLATFYGLDKLAKRSRGQRPPGSEGSKGGDASTGSDLDPAASTTPAVFWIHIVSFSAYNGVIGYLLLHREVPGLASLTFFAVAMALHFLVTDFSLNEDHKRRYRSTGRWLLVVALAVGFALGMLTNISAASVAMLVAFLAGGVILNVLKEEVPKERQSRFSAFGAGILAYSVLLLAF